MVIVTPKTRHYEPIAKAFDLLTDYSPESVEILAVGFRENEKFFLPPDWKLELVKTNKSGYPAVLARAVFTKLKEYPANIVIFPDGGAEKTAASFVSAKIGTKHISGVQRLRPGSKGIVVTRRTCSSYIMLDVNLPEKMAIVSLTAGQGENLPSWQEKTPEKVSEVESPENYIVSTSYAERSERNPLESARTIIIAGNGCRGKAFAKLEEFAQKTNATLGVTRALAFSGYGDISRIVGQSGLVVAPEICVTFGVSGAAAFLVGIESAKTVIAVNKDEMAPIFGRADYGLIADVEDVIEELLEKA